MKKIALRMIYLEAGKDNSSRKESGFSYYDDNWDWMQVSTLWLFKEYLDHRSE